MILDTRGNRFGFFLLLGAIFILALVLRLWGIGFGLPHTYHIDELPYVRTALKLGKGILGNPPYDPTGFANILFAEYGVLFVTGRILGWLPSASAFEHLYRSDPTVFVALGRLTSALLGSVTVLAVCALGKRAQSGKVGLLAAAFLSVCFLHVRDSHYGTPDVAMTCFVILCVAMCARALSTGRKRDAFFAGIAGGLAVATKWIALPVLLPLLVLAFVYAKPANGRLLGGRLLGLLFGAGLGLSLGLLAGSWQIALNPAPYWSKVGAEYTTARTPGFMGTWQIDTVSGWFFYLKTLSYGTGFVMLALAFVGLLRRGLLALRQRDAIPVLLLSFPVTYFLIMGATDHYFARYALPLVPFVALLAAEVVVMFTDWMGVERTDLKWGFGALLVFAVVAQPLSSSIRHDLLLTREDTRTLAKNWIEANVPEGSKIAVDWPVHGPPLATPEQAVPQSNRLYDVLIAGGTGLSEHPVGWYQDQGFDYLIASSFIYNIALVDEQQDKARKAFYASLDRELKLVNVLDPRKGDAKLSFIFDEIYGPAASVWQRDRPGPTLKIYQVER